MFTSFWYCSLESVICVSRTPSATVLFRKSIINFVRNTPEFITTLFCIRQFSCTQLCVVSWPCTLIKLDCNICSRCSFCLISWIVMSDDLRLAHMLDACASVFCVKVPCLTNDVPAFLVNSSKDTYDTNKSWLC